MAETRRKENIITNFLQNQTNSPIAFSTTLSNNVNKFKTTKFTNPSLIYTRKQHQQLLQAEVEKLVELDSYKEPERLGITNKSRGLLVYIKSDIPSRLLNRMKLFH